MNRPLYYALRGVSLALCTVPPLWATAEYFPLWVAQGPRSAVSGVGSVLILLALAPLWRAIGHRLRTPSLWQLWLAVWLVLHGIRQAIHGLCAIANAALPTGILGALLWKWADRMQERS